MIERIPSGSDTDGENRIQPPLEVDVIADLKLITRGENIDDALAHASILHAMFQRCVVS